MLYQHITQCFFSGKYRKTLNSAEENQVEGRKKEVEKQAL
jgi:hypothetical protein